MISWKKLAWQTTSKEGQRPYDRVFNNILAAVYPCKLSLLSKTASDKTKRRSGPEDDTLADFAASRQRAS